MSAIGAAGRIDNRPHGADLKPRVRLVLIALTNALTARINQ